VTELRAGQAVALRTSDVFNWLIAYADNCREGGYTTKVVQSEGIGLQRSSRLRGD
jgi:hypothetical protein